MRGLQTSVGQRTCGHCRASVPSEAWDTLPLVTRVDHEVVCTFIRDWPIERVIEVRRCSCGEEIARLVERERVSS
jgi:hypothetical protein